MREFVPVFEVGQKSVAFLRRHGGFWPVHQEHPSFHHSGAPLLRNPHALVTWSHVSVTIAPQLFVLALYQLALLLLFLLLLLVKVLFFLIIFIIIIIIIIIISTTTTIIGNFHSTTWQMTPSTSRRCTTGTTASTTYPSSSTDTASPRTGELVFALLGGLWWRGGKGLCRWQWWKWWRLWWYC